MLTFLNRNLLFPVWCGCSFDSLAILALGLTHHTLSNGPGLIRWSFEIGFALIYLEDQLQPSIVFKTISVWVNEVWPSRLYCVPNQSAQKSREMSDKSWRQQSGKCKAPHSRSSGILYITFSPPHRQPKQRWASGQSALDNFSKLFVLDYILFPLLKCFLQTTPSSRSLWLGSFRRSPQKKNDIFDPPPPPPPAMWFSPLLKDPKTLLS